MAKYDIDPNKRTEIYQDVLNELGNIGAGNAATALATMVNSTIRLSVTTVTLCSAEEIVAKVTPNGETLTGIHLNIVGQIQGRMLFVLPNGDNVDSLCSALMMGMDPSMIPDEMKVSALQEVGNIITASYINSISSMTGLMIDESVPTVVKDSTFMGILESMGVTNEKILLVQSRLSADSAAVSGFFMFVPTTASFSVLLNSLGIL